MEFTAVATHAPGNLDRPYFVTIRTSEQMDNAQELHKIVQAFPKSLRLGIYRVNYGPRREDNAYYIQMSVNLQPTAGNDKNETGIKRLQSFLKHAAGKGHAVTYKLAPNAAPDAHYASMDELLAHV